MLPVDQQRAYGGTLIGEILETGERPFLVRNLAAQLAHGTRTDSAFQVCVQLSLGQLAEIPHCQDL